MTRRKQPEPSVTSPPPPVALLSDIRRLIADTRARVSQLRDLEAEPPVKSETASTKSLSSAETITLTGTSAKSSDQRRRTLPSGKTKGGNT